MLFKFYSEFKADGDDTQQCNTALRCIRSGINRHLKLVRSIDIGPDPWFIKSNELFMGMQKEGKCSGKGVIKQKEITEQEDLEKLNDYFL